MDGEKKILMGGGILDYENSEALIDLYDKEIGQEGNYTVCS